MVGRSRLVSGTAFFMVIAAFLLALQGCSLKTVKPAVFGNEQSPAKVLIAADQSGFKDAVVKRLIDRLVADGAFVRLLPLSGLSQEQASDYRAVILVNTMIAWQAKPDVQSFVRRSTDKDHIFVISTAGDPKNSVDFDGVDSVTEASQIQNADEVADEVAEKVKKLL